MADLMPWEEAQQAATPSAPPTTPAATGAPAPASSAPQMPWEEAQAAASNYVRTPEEVDAALTGAPSPTDGQHAKLPPPMDNKQLAMQEAANEVQSNEAGKNFDYSTSPLRHILSEDNARELVGSQWKSNNRDLAYNSAMENAILMGAGNWLDREIHGNSPDALRSTLPNNTASEPDYAEAARAEHPIYTDLGTATGTVMGLAGGTAKAVAKGTGALIDYIKPVAGWAAEKAGGILKHAPAIAVGTYLEEKARDIWNGLKNGGEDEE